MRHEEQEDVASLKKLHLVLITKYWRNVFTLEMLEPMKVLFSETCKQMKADLIEFGGEDDHVHVLVSVPPKL